MRRQIAWACATGYTASFRRLRAVDDGLDDVTVGLPERLDSCKRRIGVSWLFISERALGVDHAVRQANQTDRETVSSWPAS